MISVLLLIGACDAESEWKHYSSLLSVEKNAQVLVGIQLNSIFEVMSIWQINNKTLPKSNATPRVVNKTKQNKTKQNKKKLNFKST